MPQCVFAKLPDGSCRCENCGFVTEPTKHDPSKIRRACSPTRNPSIPPIATRAANYARAVSRWQAAGRPERTDAEVDAIFRDFCSTCSLLVDGKCSACGCPVKPSKDDGTGIGRMSKALANKIRMATERCPVGKWPVPAEPQPTPDEIADARGIIQRGEIGKQPRMWQQSPAAREAMRQEIESKPWRIQPAQWTTDRGIVIVGGGEKYFAGALVLIRMLRELGCKLPIELWALSELEVDDRMQALAESLPGVRVVVEARHRNSNGCIVNDAGGWQAKIAAINGCDFREVLYFDADIVPAVDPTYLFDQQSYRERGAFFWPDAKVPSGYDIARETWRICGLPTPSDGTLPNGEPHNRPVGYTPFESGQMLIDRSRCAEALSATAWLNETSDFWFRPPFEFPYDLEKSGWYFYGDKSTYYLGWEMTGTPYVMAPDVIQWGDQHAGGFHHHDESGRITHQHRCQPIRKVRVGENNRPIGLSQPKLFEQAITWVESLWNGQIWENPPAWFSYPQRKADEPIWNGWGEMRFNFYRLPNDMRGQTVLDIGGHVGMFAWCCHIRGAKRIRCIEASDKNFAHLAANAKHMPGVEPMYGAAWHCQETLTFSDMSHSGEGRLWWTGRKVDSVVFDDVLRELGTVDVLKLDAEGVEWPLLEKSQELRRIKSICGEYHLNEIGFWQGFAGPGVTYSLDWLRRRLEANGFTVQIEVNRGAPASLGLFWADRA